MRVYDLRKVDKTIIGDFYETVAEGRILRGELEGSGKIEVFLDKGHKIVMSEEEVVQLQSIFKCLLDGCKEGKR